MHACGLDFGTSNSAVGIIDGNAPVLASVEGEQAMIPSAVFFDASEGDRPSFGRAAIDAYVGGIEGRLMRALKSVLSSSLMTETTHLSKKRVALIDVVTMFVRHLKTCAEARLGAPIDAVVHGRPVHFAGGGDDGADRVAEVRLQEIANRVGFKEVSFTYEPIAAAYDYELGVTREELVLVADIGGGTSDFTLIRIGPERRRQRDRRADILGNSGVRAGGTDLDRDLSMAAVMPLLGLGSRLIDKDLPMPRALFAELAWWPTINLLYQPKTRRDVRELHMRAAEPIKTGRLMTVMQKQLGHRIAFAVEDGKIALTSADATEIALAFIEPGLAASATRAAFDAAIASEMEALHAGVAECLATANLRPQDVDTVFMTGGSSRVPAVRDAILAGVPGASVARTDDFLSVATGLTVEAQRRYG